MGSPSSFTDADKNSDASSSPSLLTLSPAAPDLWRRWIATAERFRTVVPADSPARDRHVGLCFFEPSTRTRISFERAARGLGAVPYVVSGEASSLVKGESLRDTARALFAAGLELLVVRHRDAGTAKIFSEAVPVPILNAGDGANEHPTQALLDWMTMWRHFRKLNGLKILFVGDVRHSRVAHSLKFGKAFGHTFGFCAPAALVDDKLLGEFGKFEPSLDDAIPRYDVVYVLRPQRERFAEASIVDDASYHKTYGITAVRATLLSSTARIMTPGPVTAGFELDVSVAEGPQSLVFEQVVNGTFLRMALLHGAFGGELDCGEAVQ